MTEPGQQLEGGVHRRYQTIWRRILAGIVDGLVISPILLLELVVVNEDRLLPIVILWVGISYLIFHFYSVTMHARFGQTLGKMAARVKVLDLSESEVPGLKRALIRESVYVALSLMTAGCVIQPLIEKGMDGYHEVSSALAIVYGLTFLWSLSDAICALISQKRRAIHDVMAGTVVVNLPVPLSSSAGVTPSP